MPLCPLRQRRRKIPPEDVFGFGGFFGWHGLSDCAIEGGALPIFYFIFLYRALRGCNHRSSRTPRLPDDNLRGPGLTLPTPNPNTKVGRNKLDPMTHRLVGALRHYPVTHPCSYARFVTDGCKTPPTNPNVTSVTGPAGCPPKGQGWVRLLRHFLGGEWLSALRG